MKKPLLFVFSLLTTVSLACSLFTSKTPSATTAAGTSPTTTAATNTGGFTAEATSEGGALLKWKPVSGADTFLLEVQIADEFLTLASLPASQTSYEELHIPAGAHFTYRLSPVSGAKQGDSLQVSLETPPATVNPLQVTPQFDLAAASLTIDPNNFDPSTIDPNNFDPNAYIAQPIQAQALIGPAGGELSVTGSTGIVYTLTVPQDALRFDVPISLKPISTIPDLPLSGGLSAAVFIEPENLVFDVPATLRMSLPQGSPAASGALPIAFAFGRDGTDFHLYPFDGPLEQSSLSRHLASLAFAPPPPPDVAKVRNGGGFGKGSGSAKDVNVAHKRGSGNAQVRTEQDAAIDQIDELAPLQPPEVMQFAEQAQAILDRTASANDWRGFREELDNFITLINAGGDKSDYNNNINVKVLDLLIQKAMALLQKNKNECLTYDDYQAQELVERLSNPKDRFSKIMSERFKQNKGGQKLLDDLSFGVKNCEFTLSMQSKETFKSASATLTSNASAPKMKLFLTYLRGEIYLAGGGDMSLKNDFKGSCSAKIKQYDKLYLYVAKLNPVFTGGRLSDFGLGRLMVLGWEKYASIAEKGTECPTMISIRGGGDLWTGLFNIARLSLGNFILTGWTVPGATTDGGSLTATWLSNEPSFSAMGQDGKMSENTTFVLRVTQTKP